MTSALDITQSVKPPRAVFVNFPLGHQTGPPDQPDLQRQIVTRRDARVRRPSLRPPQSSSCPTYGMQTIARGKTPTTPRAGCRRVRRARLPTARKPSARRNSAAVSPPDFASRSFQLGASSFIRAAVAAITTGRDMSTDCAELVMLLALLEYSVLGGLVGRARQDIWRRGAGHDRQSRLRALLPRAVKTRSRL